VVLLLTILHLLSRTIADSCGFAKPSSLVTKLVQWLSFTFDKTFKVEKVGSFKSGKQKDSLSCGLFAVNAICCDVLKASLLVQGEIQSERVRWFNMLCQTAYETVRLSHLWRVQDGLLNSRDRRILTKLNYKNLSGILPILSRLEI
jgi:hypothetical protein